jgi:hypothetical protein
MKYIWRKVTAGLQLTTKPFYLSATRTEMKSGNTFFYFYYYFKTQAGL